MNSEKQICLSSTKMSNFMKYNKKLRLLHQNLDIDKLTTKNMFYKNFKLENLNSKFIYIIINILFFVKNLNLLKKYLILINF